MDSGSEQSKGEVLAAPPDVLSKMSVVTVVRNGADLISATIESVLEQAYPSVEFIVIDGDSTDGTQSLVQEYGRHISYFISEPDSGIYDAMNKGAGLATGELLAFLNAGDAYLRGALERVAAAYAAGGFDYIYGSTELVNERGEVVMRRRPIRQPFPRFSVLQRMPFCHQALFLRRHKFEALGGFDCSFRIAADMELLIRLQESGGVGAEVGGEPLVMYLAGGASSRTSEAEREKREIAIRNGKSRVAAYWAFASAVIKRRIAAVSPPQLVKAISRIRSGWTGS